MGFNRASTVIEHGDFAVRGGIIDLFPPGEALPVRLDFFGDVLEGARRFDPETPAHASRRSSASSSRRPPRSCSTRLDPALPHPLPRDLRRRPARRPALRRRLRGPQVPGHGALGRRSSTSGWRRVFDYLPGAQVTLDHTRRRGRRRALRDDRATTTRRASMPERRATAETPYRPCPPDLLYLDEPRLGARARRPARSAASRSQQLPLGPGVDRRRRAASAAPSRPSASRRASTSSTSLVEHARARAKDGPVVIASYSEGARERLVGAARRPRARRRAARSPPGRTSKPGVNLMVWGLEQRLRGAASVTVISEQDVLGDRLIRRRRQAQAGRELPDRGTESLTPGDLVVHLDHGVGRYTGLETVTAAGAPHECLALEYHGGDRALPAGREHRAAVPLRPGGRASSTASAAAPGRRKKAKLKQRIRDMAEQADPVPRPSARCARADVLEPDARRLRALLRPLPLPGDRRPAPRHRRRAGRHGAAARRWTG